MRGDEARLLLGFPPTSRLTLSQIKAAYKSKAWEYHPDRVPVQEKPGAESKFKLISEAYNFLLDEEIYASFILNGERSRRFTIVKGFPACQTDTQIVQLVMLESLSADWIVETEKQAMQEDVEILYNEMEQFYGDENDQYENESKCRDKGETRERPEELVTLAGARGEGSSAATYTRVVRTGVPSVHRGKSNGALIGIPFLLIVVGTVGIGAHRAYRAYEKEKLAHPSHNPFLP